MDSKQQYRIIVGERGNRYGDIVSIAPQSLQDAQTALTVQLSERGGWGRIEQHFEGFGWCNLNDTFRGVA
jgi:hypothetical protein